MALRRWAILLAIPLLVAAKKAKKPDVEIWPPPAPDTDQAGVEKPKPKPQPPVDAGDPYALDPELTAPPRSGPSLDGKADQDDDDDRCADTFDDCKEDCAVSHSQDDTLHVQRGKKLPVERCLSKCKKRYDVCEEQREAGFDRGDSEKPPERD